MDTITTDELIKFVKEKLGGVVIIDTVDDWDVLGWGVAAFTRESLQHGKYTKILQIHMTHIRIDDFTKQKKHVEIFPSLEYLPHAFWQAWYQLEPPIKTG